MSFGRGLNSVECFVVSLLGLLSARYNRVLFSLDFKLFKAEFIIPCLD